MIPLHTAVIVFVATTSFITLSIVYLCFQRWWVNIFTRWLAILSLGLSVILVYVAYNVLAIYFGWPMAAGAIVGDVAYGIVAIIGIMGVYVFIKETRRRRRENA